MAATMSPELGVSALRLSIVPRGEDARLTGRRGRPPLHLSGSKSRWSFIPRVWSRYDCEVGGSRGDLRAGGWCRFVIGKSGHSKCLWYSWLSVVSCRWSVVGKWGGEGLVELGFAGARGAHVGVGVAGGCRRSG